MSMVKVRDLRVGTVVLWKGYGGRGRWEVVVTSCDRLADLIEPARTRIAKAKSRGEMLAAAEALIAILDDLAVYGREARRVAVKPTVVVETFAGAVLSLESSRELEWLGQR